MTHEAIKAICAEVPPTGTIVCVNSEEAVLVAVDCLYQLGKHEVGVVIHPGRSVPIWAVGQATFTEREAIRRIGKPAKREADTKHDEDAPEKPPQVRRRSRKQPEPVPEVQQPADDQGQGGWKSRRAAVPVLPEAEPDPEVKPYSDWPDTLKPDDDPAEKAANPEPVDTKDSGGPVSDGSDV